MAEYTIDKIEYGDNVYKLQDSVSGYVTGNNVVPYLTCGTGAGTVAKTTTLVTGTLPATLTTGTRVAVRFTNSNTASDPTITIGSYGAIAIKRYGTTAPSTSAATSWNAGNVITLVYDGTYWLMADWTSPNTTYSEISAANITNGSGSSTGLVTGRRAKAAVEAFQTDTKVSTAAVTSGITYYPILGSDTTSAETKFYDKTGISYVGTSGSGSTSGEATLTLGNNVAGSSGKCGYLDIYGMGQYKTTLRLGSALTANRWINLPDKNGTIALTSDVVPKPPEDGYYGWVLKYAGSNSTFWDTLNVYQFGIFENEPGVYIYYGGDIGSEIQEAYMNGRHLLLQLDLINSDTDLLETYMFTDYCVQWVETNDGAYSVLWFTDIFRIIGNSQKKITVGIYLDDAQVEHELGEVTVDVREIGETITFTGSAGESNATMAANAWGEIARIQLTAGRWVVTARAKYTPTSSGNHYSAINISTTVGDSTVRDRRYGEGTYYNQHALTRIIGLDNTSYVYLNAGSPTAGTWTRTDASLQLSAIRIS